MASYREDLLADLKDPKYAAEYIVTASQESPEAFLLAFRDVNEALWGIKNGAECMDEPKIVLAHTERIELIPAKGASLNQAAKDALYLEEATGKMVYVVHNGGRFVVDLSIRQVPEGS